MVGEVVRTETDFGVVVSQKRSCEQLPSFQMANVQKPGLVSTEQRNKVLSYAPLLKKSGGP